MLTIQVADISHIPIIQTIAATTWQATYSSIISQDQIDYMLQEMYATNTLTEQIQQGHVFYLALVDATIVGFAGISKISDNSFKLNKLYVLPTVQKTGAGKALLIQAINHAKQAGATLIELQVNRANTATTFYAKHGFVVREAVDMHIGQDYYMNDYIMELTITQ